MRQFIFAPNGFVETVTVDDEGKVTAPEAGSIALAYNDDKQGLTAIKDLNKLFGEANFILGRKDEDGGPIIIPFYPNNVSVSLGRYSKPTTYEETYTIEDKGEGDYSVILVVKGIKFNERNRWTGSAYVRKGETVDTEKIAKQIAKEIDYGRERHGVHVTAEGSVITFKADKAGVDYAVLGAEKLMGVNIESEPVKAGFGTAEHIKDLADKCAADAGFEYTYRDAYYYLYPNYPLNPLAQPDKEDEGYDVLTIRFAEPRQVATHDENVNQIVQIVAPKGKLDTLYSKFITQSDVTNNQFEESGGDD